MVSEIVLREIQGVAPKNGYAGYVGRLPMRDMEKSVTTPPVTRNRFGGEAMRDMGKARLR